MPTAPEMTLKVIAHIHTAFPTKFGIPRQSGLVDEPARRGGRSRRNTVTPTPCAGWKISATSGWCGSSPARCGTAWSPTVRPPRLGGNTRMGVFATRSPFRPNPLGLSSVTAGGHRAPAGRGPGAHRTRGRPDGRHPHLRHQALHPLCRLPPGRRRGLHRADSVPPFAGGVPAGAAGTGARRPTAPP